MTDNPKELSLVDDKPFKMGIRHYEPPPPDPTVGRPKVGRNAPCPCGSGKKYKKCCGPREGAEHVANLHARQTMQDDLERLDGWSNGAIDAIQAGRHEEAERLCEELLKHYPDQIDGHERMARLREAQGRWAEAVEAYNRALLHTERYPDGFDQEAIDDYRERRDLARKKAGVV